MRIRFVGRFGTLVVSGLPTECLGIGRLLVLRNTLCAVVVGVCLCVLMKIMRLLEV